MSSLKNRAIRKKLLLKGVPRLDGSGRGLRSNYGRGGCVTPKSRGLVSKIKRLTQLEKKSSITKVAIPAALERLGMMSDDLTDLLIMYYKQEQLNNKNNQNDISPNYNISNLKPR